MAFPFEVRSSVGCYSIEDMPFVTSATAVLHLSEQFHNIGRCAAGENLCAGLLELLHKGTAF